MTVNILDSIGSILLVVLLLPKLGADGYAYIVMIAELFNFAFSITGLHNAIPFRFHPFSWVLLPSVFIFTAVSLSKRLIPFAGVFGLLARILFSALLYLLFLYILRKAPKRGKREKKDDKNAPFRLRGRQKKKCFRYRFSAGKPPMTLDKGEEARYNKDRGRSPTIL